MKSGPRRITQGSQKKGKKAPCHERPSRRYQAEARYLSSSEDFYGLLNFSYTLPFSYLFTYSVDPLIYSYHTPLYFSIHYTILSPSFCPSLLFALLYIFPVTHALIF